MANRAKNHHIVPKVLQRQFSISGDPGRIWRAKRGSGGKYASPERKRIEKTLAIKDYYTVLEGDKRSDLIEREFYGRLDNFLGQILPQVIETLNDGSFPRFSEHILDSIRRMAMHMAKRTPDFLDDHDDIELGRELVSTTLQYLPKHASSDQRKRLETDLESTVRLRDRGRHIRVSATLKDSKRVNEALSEFVPRWAISKTKHSFVLSSRMVYRIGNGGSNGLSNPNMEMWMPITPKVSLVLVRDPQNVIPHRVIEPSTHIRQINEFAARNSFEIASHSETLLKSLLRQIK